MRLEDNLQEESGSAEHSASDFGDLVRHRWRLLAGAFLLGAVVGAVYSLLLPNEFEATASVMPPPDPRGSSGLAALASQVGGVAPIGAMFQGSGTKDVFLGILKSRTMQDDLIGKFDLVKEYEVNDTQAPMQNARNRLRKMTDIKASREGVISVTVSAYDPQRAADMANFYVENLDRLNTALNVTDAGRSRSFLEGRVSEARTALRDAEDKLRRYQSQSRAVVMEGQAKAAIEGAARLEGQIQAAEVQLRHLETFSTARNPDVIKLKESIEEMRQQLRRAEYGRGDQRAAGGGQRAADRGQKAAGKERQVDGAREFRPDGGESTGADFAMPLGAIPEAGLSLARLIREAKIQETIYTLLTQQLEQAKFAEAKDMATVRILDRAVPPEWKSRPSIRNNTLAGGLLSLLVAGLLAFVLERRRGADSTR